MPQDHTLTDEEWTDALVDRILAMSDEEVRAEFIKEGLDPDKEAAKVGAIIDKVIAEHYRKFGKLQ